MISWFRRTNTLATKWHAVSTQYTTTIYTQICVKLSNRNLRSRCILILLENLSFFLQIDVASRACGWFLMYLQIDYLFNFVGCTSQTALSSTHDSKIFYIFFSVSCLSIPLSVFVDIDLPWIVDVFGRELASDISVPGCSCITVSVILFSASERARRCSAFRLFSVPMQQCCCCCCSRCRIISWV